ncbi:MAG: hypothetical protein H7258_15700 [Ferruginibacter sp.]|nr:hypothetical protein [Ferruginibacter sp.]
MNILRLAFELFVIYMLYKMVFEFIIPVYRTTKQMKQKMNEMHQKMQPPQEVNNKNHSNSTQQPKTPKETFSDDYIEYEEIK